MVMMTKDTTALYAVSGGTTDNILGNLVWFSVSDMEILRDELVKLAVTVGLPEKYVPAPIRPLAMLFVEPLPKLVVYYGQEKRLWRF